jgi:hypothetical protein
MVVALLALFVALGGTGYAINEWNGSNIQDNTIASADLKDGDVRNVDLKPDAIGTTRILDHSLTGDDLNVIEHQEVATEEQYAGSANSIGDLPTPGPSVTFKVPPSRLFAAYAEVGLGEEGTGGAVVNLHCGSENFEILNKTESGLAVKRTTPGDGPGTNTARGGPLMFGIPAGLTTMTCKLEYGHFGEGVANFKNRNLWIMTFD